MNPLRHQESVRILPPDYALKQKIGIDIDIHKIFTPERIAAAQKTIDDSQGEFVSWAGRDLTELEHTYRALDRNLDEAGALRMEKVRKIAFSLKCQSGTFGFDLGSEVAKSLYNYAMKHPNFTRENLVVLRKHLDALQVIFQQNIVGEGGSTGKELMANLLKLVEKLP